MPKHTCHNCGAITNGNFCTNCGQQTGIGRLSLGVLTQQTVTTILGDSASNEGGNYRYGILGTIWAIISHPGKTVGEYISGCHRRYFAPITLLILIATAYVFLSQLIDYSIFRADQIAVESGQADAAVIGSMNRLFETIFGFYNAHPALVQFVILLFISFILKLVFHRHSHYNYIEYFYVGIFTSIVSMLLILLQAPFLKYLPYLETPISAVGYALQIAFEEPSTSSCSASRGSNRSGVTSKY